MSILSSPIDKCSGLLDYMMSTWVGDEIGQDLKPSFDHTLWNYFNSKKVRTNNNLEGYHSRLKKIILSPKPSIFKLIDTIKLEDDKFNAKNIRLRFKLT